jgi:hypothetical protein
MTEIGGALGVPLLAVPSIGKVGAQFVLNLKIIGVEEAKVRVRKSRMVHREVDLPAAVLALTDDVMKGLFGVEAMLTAGQATRRFQGRLMRGVSLVLAVGAAGALTYSVSDLNAAQAAHANRGTGMTNKTWDALKIARDQAVEVRIGVLASSAVAAALWSFAPRTYER